MPFTARRHMRLVRRASSKHVRTDDIPAGLAAAMQLPSLSTANFQRLGSEPEVWCRPGAPVSDRASAHILAHTCDTATGLRLITRGGSPRMLRRAASFGYQHRCPRLFVKHQRSRRQPRWKSALGGSRQVTSPARPDAAPSPACGAQLDLQFAGGRGCALGGIKSSHSAVLPADMRSVP
jgi:hypothetical protein